MLNRLFVDDPSKKNPLAKITTPKLAVLGDFHAPVKQFITPTPDDKVTLSAKVCIALDSGGLFFADNDIQIGAEALDAGTAFTVGSDYYIYVCDTQNLEQPARLVISKNATYPIGWNVLNSRKIGGFHFGGNRRVNSALEPINSSGVAFGSGWEANVYDGIVSRSVWTSEHRPKSAPEGMVYLGSGTWVDIYIASDDGNGGLASVYNALPMTGTEGMSWYTFNERAMKSGKRMLSYDEFCQAANGSPQGNDANNDNAWSATTNTGRKQTGQVVRAVSAIGTRDYVGDVWKWLRDLITNASGRVLSGTTNPVSYTYTDRFAADGVTRPIVTNGTAHGATTRADSGAPVAGAWGWDRATPFPGRGNIYEYYDQSLIALIAGGNWCNGASDGSRAVSLNFYPWGVFTYIGVVCASESL